VRFGTWTSPITAQAVAAQGLRLGGVSVDGDDIYWLEGRPSEGGRNVIVRRSEDGAIADVLPVGFNARSRVHEYGGGSYVVSGGQVYFVNFDDQRIYACAGGTARAITPPGAWRYADFAPDVTRRRLVCVREDHSKPGREPVNMLVSIPLDGRDTAGEVIASGYDFYSTPRLSPDGSMLAWLAWRHPQMPWDGTELWVADVDAGGTLKNARCVAGGVAESIYQPGWSPDNRLVFVSDRDGWWRLYRSNGSNRSTRSGPSFVPVLPRPPEEAEFGRPQWTFGTATWAFADPATMVAAYTRGGRWNLAVIDVPSGTIGDVAPGFEPNEWLAATSAHAVLVGGSATLAESIVRVSLHTGGIETLRRSSDLELDPDLISLPEPFEYPSGEATGYAFYYPPAHPAESASVPTGERPPLIAIGHGGPTMATRATLDLKIQFWTSRGFAVVDVNYGGSSGYGRAYRERLRARWGIADVSDMVNAARFLVAEGRADRNRLIIRGGSAGGYTTLATLAFHPGLFSAGASYYGISDLEVLARDTHKFEARYLDALVGPYPAARDEYEARSPIRSVERLACALILFQGLEDKVVPPNQSAMIADAARDKGLPVAYLVFDGEQHGFRKAETIARCLEAELWFYGAVFGFTPADRIEPVTILNLEER
jgi:dipeptidyl aminopeptidase/acylaminoacyl peptidase